MPQPNYDFINDTNWRRIYDSTCKEINHPRKKITPDQLIELLKITLFTTNIYFLNLNKGISIDKRISLGNEPVLVGSRIDFQINGYSVEGGCQHSKPNTKGQDVAERLIENDVFIIITI